MLKITGGRAPRKQLAVRPRLTASAVSLAEPLTDAAADSLLDKIDSQKRELDVIKDDLDQSEKRRHELAGEKNKLEEKINHMVECEYYEDVVTSMQEQNVEIAMKYEDKVEKMQKKIENQRDRLADMEHQLDDMATAAKILEEDRRRARALDRQLRV